MPTLITLVFSHYNERARWALDLADVDYEERAWMPFFSQAAVAAATWGSGGEGDRVSSRFSTPMLRLDNGERLADSGEIVRWAAEHGAPSLRPPDHVEEIDAWEQRAHDVLGPHARRAAYFHVLQSPSLLARLGTDNVGPAQALAWRLLLPLARGGLRRGLGVTPQGYERSLERTRAELDHVAEHLQGRSYLVGDHFTAADLTVACMAVPVLLVQPEEGYAARFPPLADLPEGAADLVRSMREHPAGAWALRMFAEHRPPPKRRAS